MSEPNRAVCLFLHFELLDECSEMPGLRSPKGVVLFLQALLAKNPTRLSRAALNLLGFERDAFRNSTE